MNSLVLNPTFEPEGLLGAFAEGTAALLGSVERGADDAAVADNEGFFCVTLVQSLMFEVHCNSGNGQTGPLR